jgi:hypothetical protein
MISTTSIVPALARCNIAIDATLDFFWDVDYCLDRSPVAPAGSVYNFTHKHPDGDAEKQHQTCVHID